MAFQMSHTRSDVAGVEDLQPHAPIQVGIVDSHAIVRQALRHWLDDQQDLSFAGEAVNGAEALALVKRVAIDVLLLDLMMPDQNGLDIVGSLRARAPTMAILVFTDSPETEYARFLYAQGVQGFVPKSCQQSQLLQAIRRVAAGELHFSKEFGIKLTPGVTVPSPSPLHQLSKREFQILLLLATGSKSGGASCTLHLSAKTVSMHRTKLIRKLELSTNSDLTYFAIKHGLLK
ncbi:MAG: response regulator transcription factor [Variovorax sp.]|nr:MAG: response regulator transcription factor [Variovorax sp.]